MSREGVFRLAQLDLPIPLGGLDVPLEPIRPSQEFLSYDTWCNPYYGLLTVAAFNSARSAHALLRKKKGPKGGWWYAVDSAEAWTKWVLLYRERVQRRLNGEAARRLGYAGRMRR